MANNYAVMNAPKGSLLHNDPGIFSGKNQADLNRGGGPHGVRNKKRVSTAQRGGFGQGGRDEVRVRAPMGGGRQGAGNPATRGRGIGAGEARRGAFTPETRVPGHGGSPQVREREQGNYPLRGGFGAQGQGRQDRIVAGELPNYGPANPAPGRGNTGGLAYRRIAGRFKRASMGARATGDGGKYGSPPVTSNT